MPDYSITSAKHLGECHIDLQRLMTLVVEGYDNAIIEGYRSDEEQLKALLRGVSTLGPGQSKHNRSPSEALDAVPYPVKWPKRNPETREEWREYVKCVARFYHFAGYVQGVASRLGIAIRWGGDWDGDRQFDDQSFDDLPHFELV
jgi:peptidoglycan L-alanyl-D-glutamate endopeptidase CwlK